MYDQFTACRGLGDDGHLHPARALDGLTYLYDVPLANGARNRNYAGTLRDAFTAMAVLPIGCTFTQPLAAARRALENPDPEFLRPEASLGIVFMSAEDDCTLADRDLMAVDESTVGPLQHFRCTHYGVTCDGGGATPDAMNELGRKFGCHANPASTYVDDVGPYVEAIAAAKPDPQMIMLGAIVGAPSRVEVAPTIPFGSSDPVSSLDPACFVTTPEQPNSIEPGVRMTQVATMFPGRHVVGSPCDDNVDATVSNLGHELHQLVGDPCLEADVKTVPTALGIKPLCSATDGDAILPACDELSTDRDCFRFVRDPTRCPLDQHLRLEVVRTSPPTVQRFIHVACLPQLPARADPEVDIEAPGW